MSTPSKTICVLGMHRSGTSCLAGTLQQAGVSLGEVFTRNRFNAKGNREHARIRQLHQHLLLDNGGHWYRPPDRVLWHDHHRAERDAIIRTFAGHPCWGFKDPRSLLTLDGWLEALPDMQLAGIVRHPYAVAVSLNARPNGPTLEEGLALWAVYNRRLLERYRRSPFPIVSFDLPDDLFRDKLASMASALGLAVAAGQLDFFEPQLRHGGPRWEISALRGDVETIYRSLLAVLL